MEIMLLCHFADENKDKELPESTQGHSHRLWWSWGERLGPRGQSYFHTELQVLPQMVVIAKDIRRKKKEDGEVIEVNFSNCPTSLFCQRVVSWIQPDRIHRVPNRQVRTRVLFHFLMKMMYSLASCKYPKLLLQWYSSGVFSKLLFQKKALL